MSRESPGCKASENPRRNSTASWRWKLPRSCQLAHKSCWAATNLYLTQETWHIWDDSCSRAILTNRAHHRKSHEVRSIWHAWTLELVQASSWALSKTDPVRNNQRPCRRLPMREAIYSPFVNYCFVLVDRHEIPLIATNPLPSSTTIEPDGISFAILSDEVWRTFISAFVR